MTCVEPASVNRMICPLPKPQTVPPLQGIPVGSVYSVFPVNAWNSSLLNSAQASAGACAQASHSGATKTIVATAASRPEPRPIVPSLAGQCDHDSTALVSGARRC